MTNLFSLEGKVALVTGAAYGIGFAIAEALANAGAKIAFNCRGQEHLDKALADYRAKGIEAHGYICDVTNENDVEKMVTDIRKELGHIDILVNNAGIIKRIPMHEMKREEFQQVIDIDLVGPFIMTKAVIPEMMERKEGKIINICSMMSELGRETVSAYAAAKGGLKMLTRNICSEYGEYNIQCMLSAQDTLPPHRQLLCANVRLMVAAIHSTRSSVPRLQLDVGSILKSWLVLQYSLLLTHQMQLTDIFFMLMEAYWPTLANSPNKCIKHQLHKNGDPEKSPHNYFLQICN